MEIISTKKLTIYIFNLTELQLAVYKDNINIVKVLLSCKKIDVNLYSIYIFKCFYGIQKLMHF